MNHTELDDALEHIKTRLVMMLITESPMTTCSTTGEEKHVRGPAASASRRTSHRRTGSNASRDKPKRNYIVESNTSHSLHDACCVGSLHVRSKHLRPVGTPSPRKGCNASQEWVLEDLLIGHLIYVVPVQESGEIVCGTVVARVDDGGRGGRHEMVLESGACRSFDLTQVDDWALVNE